jgi:hypothetical protein
MPSRPPPTAFYDNGENAELWRDISRLYEDFLGSDEEQWMARQERFLSVIIDIRVKLRDKPRARERQ